jgi:uncharacterized protein (UPF0332 family)
MDLIECQHSGLVKKVKPDENRQRSLVQIAFRKRAASEALEEEFFESKLSLFYDAIRMVLESIALGRGFMVNNHECFLAFLTEVIGESQMGEAFDKFRKVRNGINYYAEILTLEEAQEVLQQMYEFFPKTLGLIQG